MSVLHFAIAFDGDSTMLPGNPVPAVATERPNPANRDQLIRLFREIRMPLYGYLVCIGVKPHEADDVVQEVFLRLYQQLESGAKIEEPRAWLFRVARNLSLNLQRVQRRLVFEADMDPREESRLEELSAPEMNPEAHYLKSELMARLDAGVARLTEQQRHCIFLRSQGLRYREIADILGVSVSSAAELLQRAVVRLTGELNG
jgi:RNA polymerase sigma-70 factor (ECF subfamily)